MMKYKTLSEQLDKPLSDKYLELFQKARDIYEELGGEERPVRMLFKL